MNNYEKDLEKLTKRIGTIPDDAKLLKQRAELLYKLGQYGGAINDLNKVLEVEPDNREVKTQLEMIQTILRFANTDIYASPNTNFDPWLE